VSGTRGEAAARSLTVAVRLGSAAPGLDELGLAELVTAGLGELMAAGLEAGELGAS
jgi:hypothetical protein